MRLFTTDERISGRAQPVCAGPAGGPIIASTVRRRRVRTPPRQQSKAARARWDGRARRRGHQTFVFRRGSYRDRRRSTERTAGAAPWHAAPTCSSSATRVRAERSMFDVEHLRGPAIYDGQKYRKLDIGRTGQFNESFAGNGWMAEMQHHFVSAVPPSRRRSTTRSAWTAPLAGRPPPADPAVPAAPPGAVRHAVDHPKLQARSRNRPAKPHEARPRRPAEADGLAAPLFWLLSSRRPNWSRQLGLVVIIVNHPALKLLFYKLTGPRASRSMAKMRAIGPRIKSLQDATKDDREALGKT